MDGNALPQKVAVSEGVMLQEIEGESVLLDLKSEKYYGLNSIGTRFWGFLLEDPRTDSAVRRLLSEYEVDELILRDDLGDLVEDLKANGLVSISSA